MFKFYESKKEKGFTIIESLVSTAIFSLSILVVMSTLGQNLADIRHVKQKLTAEYLAQEGIEYIRNMRDTYMLYSSTPTAGWTSFRNKLTNASCQNANGCYFNDQNLNYNNANMPITEITVTACGSNNCPSLLYNNTTGKYNYVTGANSGISRKIRIIQTNANELRVFSTTSWAQGSGTYSITFSEDLFNWIE